MDPSGRRFTRNTHLHLTSLIEAEQGTNSQVAWRIKAVSSEDMVVRHCGFERA